MTEIKMLKDAGGRKAGDSAEVRADVASHLIDAGYAEAAETKGRTSRAKAKADDEKGGGDSPAE